jgi:hypothetical protein
MIDSAELLLSRAIEGTNILLGEAMWFIITVLTDVSSPEVVFEISGGIGGARSSLGVVSTPPRPILRPYKKQNKKTELVVLPDVNKDGQEWKFTNPNLFAIINGIISDGISQVL